ncbi:MAG: hypothetical protein KTR32_09625 [Granulosicoccus sp.]|nr:hypothetical protein [Granulosicoccus sp.]
MSAGLSKSFQRLYARIRCHRLPAALTSPLLLLGLAMPALTHANEPGYFMLMPTTMYTTAALAAVIATMLVLVSVSPRVVWFMYKPIPVMKVRNVPLFRTVTSLASMMILFGLLTVGIIGSNEPTQNPLPLYFWTIWWIGIIALHGLFGNLWYYINPWSGVLYVIDRLLPNDSRSERARAVESTLKQVAMWPAITVFVIFALFYIVYPTPDDPFRLAMVILGYWVTTLIAMCWFGERGWSNRGEFISILTRGYSRLAPVGVLGDRLCVGLPGWRIASMFSNRSTSKTTALFILLLLGVGSFDGFKGTILWLSMIGIDPLEFPGRSAVLWQNTVGAVIVNALVITLFAACVWLGNYLGRDKINPIPANYAFRSFAVSLLPIAFAFHVAHYLTTFLINAQHALAATSDPFANGANLLGLGSDVVSTGFLDTYGTARRIWIFQALVVVSGHIISVVIARMTAMRLYRSTRRIILSQLPVAGFLMAYTYLGLWLLALPKGV